MSQNKAILLTFGVLIFSIVFFAQTDVDIWVQDLFFDKFEHQWILDSNLQPYKFIFYDGLKRFLILIAVGILLSLIFLRKKAWVKAYRRGMIVVVLSAILVPVVVGALKKTTNMPCPKNEIHYGGVYPKVKVWEHYPKSFHQEGTSKCWPAGHASGGFALLSLWFLFKSRRNKHLALVTALTVGWSMGLYKMLVGDHFLSHTVITMLLAWLIILLVDRLLPNR